MKKLAVFTGSVALCIASPAFAAISCTGVVKQTFMEPNGDTYVSWGDWSTRICNPGQTWNIDRGPGGGGGTTMTPATCQMLMSMFMSAKAQGKQVTVNVDKTSCTFTGGFETPYPYAFIFLP